MVALNPLLIGPACALAFLTYFFLCVLFGKLIKFCVHPRFRSDAPSLTRQSPYHSHG